MNTISLKTCIILSLFFFGEQSLTAQDIQKTYYDEGKGEVILPLGDISFADTVIAFEEGNPGTDQGDAYKDPQRVLHAPDYEGDNGLGSTTLGCYGRIVVGFTDMP